MGLYFRRRVRLGRGTWLNLSRSGASVSERVGRVTVNSRGRYWARLGGGVYARGTLPRRSHRVHWASWVIVAAIVLLWLTVAH